MLDDPPWNLDFNSRLVRNDGTLRFRGVQHAHADPVEPCEYLEEPVYHLELLLAGTDQRRDKAIRYEVANPLMIAAGGGRINEAFYLPELRPSLRTRPLPAADRAAVERVLGARGTVAAAAAGHAARHDAGDGPPLGGPRRPGIRLPRRHRAGRDGAGARARGGAERALPGHQRRHRAVAARPRPTPGDPRQLPLAAPRRLRPHRRRAPHGLHPRRGPRRADPRAARRRRATRARGATCSRSTSSHEDVRWFGQGCRVEVDAALQIRAPARRLAVARIAAAAAPPAPAGRYADPAACCTASGSVPLRCRPAHVEFGRGFERLHPHWEMRLWTDADLDALEPHAMSSSTTCSQPVRALQPHALRDPAARLGGVYFDTDVESRRPLDGLLAGVNAFTALELARPRRHRRARRRARHTRPSSARPGSRARRSGWDRTRPTPTALLSSACSSSRSQASTSSAPTSSTPNLGRA